VGAFLCAGRGQPAPQSGARPLAPCTLSRPAHRGMAPFLTPVMPAADALARHPRTSRCGRITATAPPQHGPSAPGFERRGPCAQTSLCSLYRGGVSD